MSAARTPVLYVAGSGHTGSTLLALLLDSHPEIACVGESSIKPTIVNRGSATQHNCSCGARVVECPFWGQVFTLVREQGLELGATSWTNDYRFDDKRAQKLFKRACASPSGRRMVRWAADHVPVYRDWVSRTDAVNLAFISAVLRVSHARVFADTSKSLPRLVHLLRLPPLDVRLVLLVRDVRGYAASAKRRGLTVADAARTWLRDQTAIADVSAQMGPDRLHRLHYEELCSAPGPTLQRLWAFAGVADEPVPETVAAARHHVLGNSMRLGGEIRIRLDQSWRDRLDARETDDILAIAGDVNRSLGYV